ncbi:MAG: hypothetical protein ACI83D_000678 [Planctomycetota bacterium]|jgi:hypothetical protein
MSIEDPFNTNPGLESEKEKKNEAPDELVERQQAEITEILVLYKKRTGNEDIMEKVRAMSQEERTTTIKNLKGWAIGGEK